jgi:hypothetical protein
MSDGERWAAVTLVATTVALRLLDYMLPTGRHWRFMNRLTVDDDDGSCDHAGGGDDMGGKPSRGTPKDGRLSRNKPTPKRGGGRK